MLGGIAMKDDRYTFEQKMLKLNELSSNLERGDISLEEMLRQFEEGVKVYRECFEILEATESKIMMIMQESGNMIEKKIDK